MKHIIRIAVIMCLMPAPIMSHAQSDLYQLVPGEYVIGMHLGFQEHMTALSGSLTYGISNALLGSLTAGLGFADEDPFLSAIDVSIPPIRMFKVALGTVNRLRTGLSYWGVISFVSAFEKFVDDATDRTLMTIDASGISSSIGLIKKIPTEFGVILVPSVGISYAHIWTTGKSDYASLRGYYGLSNTEYDSTWGGNIGLSVEISPEISIAGTVGFSFEESDILFGIGISLRS